MKAAYNMKINTDNKNNMWGVFFKLIYSLLKDELLYIKKIKKI